MKAVDEFSSGQASLALIPILGLAIDVLAQLVQSHLPHPAGHVRKQFISFGAGFAVSGAVLLSSLLKLPVGAVDFAGYLLLQMLTYAFLGFCFFNLVNLNVSSMRIRMIIEIQRQDPRPVPDSTLKKRYSMSEVLDARLLRLENGRQLDRRGDRFYLRRGAVVHIAHFFLGLRSLLFGKSA